MDQGEVTWLIIVHELLLANPLEQFRDIGCFEVLTQAISLLVVVDVLPDGQQVLVMVAEYAYQRLADAIEEAQGFQRLWATVDEITHQPQAISGRVEGHLLEQALERFKATLNITDGIRRHQCNAPGTARRNGAMMAS